MKLQIVKARQRGGIYSDVPDRLVYVNRRCRTFAFNTGCIRTFGLKHGMRVLLAKDTESHNDWYVAFDIPKIPESRILHLNGRPGSGLKIQHLTASEEILDSVKAERAATFIVGAKTIERDGIRWYRIMTATPVRII